MDKLVSVKGLVIRTTPIIPDMKDGVYHVSQKDPHADAVLQHFSAALRAMTL